MKLKAGLPLVAALLLTGFNTLAQDTNFWIFLCFGQSNMEGYPGVQEQDKTVDPRLQMLACVDFPAMSRTKGQWYNAVPPLCRPGTGLCPADYFGRTLVSNLPANIKIGLVNVSVAGCKIEMFDKTNFHAYADTQAQWMQNIVKTYGGNPYQYLVDMGKLAQKDGVIKGILLHQGESNAGDREWPNKVKGVYDNLCKDLNLDPKKTPLLVGGLSNPRAGLNKVIDEEIPKTIPNGYGISSKGCESRPDNLHFTPAGYRELGTRYGNQLLIALGYKQAEKPQAEKP